MTIAGSESVAVESFGPELLALDLTNTEKLVWLGPTRTLAAGEVLFRRGDVKVNLLQIVTGIICVYRPHSSGWDQVVEFAFPGDVLGLGYLEHEIDWAKALVETRLRCLPPAALVDVVSRDQRTRRRHALALDREFQYRRDVVSKANCQNPLARVAAFFLVASQINSDEGRDRHLIVNSLECGLVGKWLGLDLDTLGSALVGLKRKGLIEASPGSGVRLRDVAGLKRLADEGDQAPGSADRTSHAAVDA